MTATRTARMTRLSCIFGSSFFVLLIVVIMSPSMLSISSMDWFIPGFTICCWGVDVVVVGLVFIDDAVVEVDEIVGEVADATVDMVVDDVVDAVDDVLTTKDVVVDSVVVVVEVVDSVVDVMVDSTGSLSEGFRT